MDEGRISALEEKLCLADDMLDVLNRTVFRQQEQIEQLQAQIRVLYQQLQARAPESGEPRDLREEIPPHY